MFYLVFWRARAIVGDNDIFNRCAGDLPVAITEEASLSSTVCRLCRRQ